jgi:hypothetical protein
MGKQKKPAGENASWHSLSPAYAAMDRPDLKAGMSLDSSSDQFSPLLRGGRQATVTHTTPAL